MEKEISAESFTTGVILCRQCGKYYSNTSVHHCPKSGEKEIEIVGWWCVFVGEKPYMVVESNFIATNCAGWLSDFLPFPREHIQIKQITAKVDFTFEQIQAELCKRVDKVQAVCFENPKL